VSEVRSRVRLISNLRSAQRCEPKFPAQASNPAAVLGLRYERKLVRTLRSTSGLVVEHNPWFEFIDANGWGCCSLDVLVSGPRLGPKAPVLILECKLTWKPEAEEKLRGLYEPIVTLALDLPVRSIRSLTVAKHLTPEAPPAAQSITEALESGLRVLHWIGTWPLPLI
jgi:hypothetical protein